MLYVCYAPHHAVKHGKLSLGKHHFFKPTALLPTPLMVLPSHMTAPLELQVGVQGRLSSVFKYLDNLIFEGPN